MIPKWRHAACARRSSSSCGSSPFQYQTRRGLTGPTPSKSFPVAMATHSAMDKDDLPHATRGDRRAQEIADVVPPVDKSPRRKGRAIRLGANGVGRYSRSGDSRPPSSNFAAGVIRSAVLIRRLREVLVPFVGRPFPEVGRIRRVHAVSPFRPIPLNKSASGSSLRPCTQSVPCSRRLRPERACDEAAKRPRLVGFFLVTL